MYINKFYEITDGEVQRHIYAGNLKVATLSDTVEYPTCTTPTAVAGKTTVWKPTQSCMLTGTASGGGSGGTSGSGSSGTFAVTMVFKLANDTGKRLIYHHTDHLTGASVETDSTGVPIEVLDYYPYGSEHLNTRQGRYNTPHKFTGKELDTDTGLYYYGARYYDSSLGRFTSLDPWGGDMADPQSFNKYSYVRNNPLKYTDPTGKSALSVLQWSWGTGFAASQIDGPLPGPGDAIGAGIAGSGSIFSFGVFADEASKSAPPMTPEARRQHEKLQKIMPGPLDSHLLDTPSEVNQGLCMGCIEYVNPPTPPSSNNNSGKKGDDDRPKGVPPDWKETPSKKGDGRKFQNPNNPSENVRDMPGNPKSPNPAQRKPYTKQMRDGKALDGEGRPVDPKSPESHIPKSEFRFTPRP